jgi:hypothetical protein
MSSRTTNSPYEIGQKTIEGTLRIVGSATVDGDLTPEDGCVGNIGTSDLKWETIYTKEINLVNDRGDWTVIPEESYLSVRNNKTGRLYKLPMEEIG